MLFYSIRWASASGGDFQIRPLLLKLSRVSGLERSNATGRKANVLKGILFVVDEQGEKTAVQMTANCASRSGCRADGVAGTAKAP
jgi:hypothetical protein